jgi:cyclic pyranopterin phosphate synthase
MNVMNKGRLRLLITDSCNLACSYCHNEGQFGNGHFMSVAAARDLAQYLIANEIEVKNLIISGGEPTIHPDLTEIISVLRPSAAKISMVTNGVRLDEPRLRELAAAGLTYAKFGIDAVDAQTTKGPLDRQPRAVSRDAVLANALYAAEIMPGSHLNTVVSKFNVDRVPELIDWCDRNRIGVKFLELIEVRSSIHQINPVRPGKHAWFASMYEKTKNQLSGFAYNPEVMKFYAATSSGQTVQFSENFCRFGACSQLWTRIDSRGQLIPCIQRPDVRELSFGVEGLSQIRSVNEEMTQRSNWPCFAALEPPQSSGDDYSLWLESGEELTLPLTERSGCIG